MVDLHELVPPPMLVLVYNPHEVVRYIYHKPKLWEL